MVDRWGVQLTGSQSALRFWLSELKRPFDPYLEMIEDERGDFVVLRSKSFASLKVVDDVNEEANAILATIHVVQHGSLVTNPLELGPIVEFSDVQLPRRTHVLKIAPIIVRAQLGTPETRVRDRLERPVAIVSADTSEMQPSSVQRWLEAAAVDGRIKAAIGHLHGQPGWVEFYKVFEALKTVPTPNVSDEKKDRLRRTANVHRHHKTTSAPNNPMTLAEAREFIHFWLDEATKRVVKGQR
jgi:hypothetical protein